LMPLSLRLAWQALDQQVEVLRFFPRRR